MAALHSAQARQYAQPQRLEPALLATLKQRIYEPVACMIEVRKVLLVGINYDKKSKKHQCRIERLEGNISTQKDADTTQKKTNTTQKPLTATQKRVKEYIEHHPSATRREIAAALENVSEDGVKYTIEVLKKRCGLHRLSGRKDGLWLFSEQ